MTVCLRVACFKQLRGQRMPTLIGGCDAKQEPTQSHVTWGDLVIGSLDRILANQKWSLPMTARNAATINWLRPLSSRHCLSSRQTGKLPLTWHRPPPPWQRLPPTCLRLPPRLPRDCGAQGSPRKHIRRPLSRGHRGAGAGAALTVSPPIFPGFWRTFTRAWACRGRPWASWIRSWRTSSSASPKRPRAWPSPPSAPPWPPERSRRPCACSCPGRLASTPCPRPPRPSSGTEAAHELPGHHVSIVSIATQRLFSEPPHLSRKDLWLWSGIYSCVRSCGFPLTFRALLPWTKHYQLYFNKQRV